MTSRYDPKSPEFWYSPPSKQVLPEKDEEGFKFLDDDHMIPALPWKSIPRQSGLTFPFPKDRTYRMYLTMIANEAAKYRVAFARGDDQKLKGTFCVMENLMNRIFQGATTLGTPWSDDDSGLPRWEPRNLCNAIAFMGHFFQRIDLEYEQATMGGFELGEDAQKCLKDCRDTLSEVAQGCLEWPLFKRDEGWWFHREYDELWETVWKSRVAPRTASIATQAQSPAETPVRAASPAILPAAASQMAAIATAAPMEVTPVDATAAQTRMRTKLPDLPTQGNSDLSEPQRLQGKRSRSPQLLLAATPSPKKPKLPPTGWFRPPEQAIPAKPSTDKTRKEQAKGSRLDGIDLGPPGQVRLAKPEVQNPPTRPSKTDKEKAKGARLDGDEEGQDAQTPCAACSKSHLRCRVAKDPVKFYSLKCNHCIAGKLGSCFTAGNPGFPYSQKTLEVCRRREDARVASMQRARRIAGASAGQKQIDAASNSTSSERESPEKDSGNGD
ncbi:hypothetical protein PG995_006017 [Apiospora arundinis]